MPVLFDFGSVFESGDVSEQGSGFDCDKHRQPDQVVPEEEVDRKSHESEEERFPAEKTSAF